MKHENFFDFLAIHSNFFRNNCANFRDDSLHLTATGYDVLAGILKQGSN